ncbi:MAG TPA: DNA ligase D [Solirubrobacteraceae bacterium]|nr:DNA ligase D [Solirubrobacteraceae bacterium]
MTPELDEYERRRDFAATTEPAPGAPDPVPEGAARFVVQEHSARSLHWDLRLEREGALASWALPRGVPDDPKRNRLAVRTEDHPLEYLDFHGEIPAGQYGAGTMRIWDHGTYVAEKWRSDEVIATFSGERMRGRYALFHTGGKERDWMIHRMDPALEPDRAPLPTTLTPMLARAGPLPRGEQWAYEIKWDGVRALAWCEPGQVLLRSRTGRDITSAYPELRRLARALGSRPALLDGEIVAFDADGRPSFQRLQERMNVDSDATARRRAAHNPVSYVIFDVLHLDGESLLERPYDERRERLQALELAGEHWQTPAAHHGDGPALVQASREMGLEGLVAKRRQSPYEPGRRTGAWVKVKNALEIELAVGGWTRGAGHRRPPRRGAGERIGALLLGERGPDGTLRYAGRVGSGLDEGTRRTLGQRLLALERPESPFAPGKPEPPADASWVEPRLLARVEYRERTSGGLLRQPVFKSVREAEGPDQVTVAGRAVRLTNREKVLYPAVGFTKGDVIDYYAGVADVLLAHLGERALTLRRFPDGVERPAFFEKNCPRHRPEWMATVRDPSSSTENCVLSDAAGVVWTANLAALELHASLSLAAALDEPTLVVFDLDPGPPADVLACAEVALVLRGLFDAYGLRSAVKTSGGKGLQVYLPIARGATYAQTKGFARSVAEMLAGQAPELVVSRMSRDLRAGRVLVDWSQNDRHKTTIGAYSLRGQPEPTVSTPVRWEEVADAHARGEAARLRFTAGAVLERVRRHGDLFADALWREQELPAG